jgi:erythromycin esterase
MTHNHGPQSASVLAACVSVAIALGIHPARSQAQQGSAKFERWVAAHAIPLVSLEPAATTADLRQLRSIIGSARVVAMGEPAHGAHEPLAFRNRLFRYLVEQLGFTAIVLESGLPESRHVHTFVESGVGNASQVARKNLTYGFGEFRENVELIQWMRDYNANQAHHRKIRFYGFDLSLGGPLGVTPRPGPFSAALELLSRGDSGAANRLREALQPILRLPPDAPPSLTVAERDATALAVDELLSRLERTRPLLLVKTSAADYEWGYRSAVVAQQVARFQRLLHPIKSDSVTPSAWEAVETRDVGMANNIRWIMDQEGPTGRVLVFAHNVHVMNAPWRGLGIWNVFARPPNGLGVYLRAIFGSDLVIIGVSSAANGTGLPTATLDSSSLDASLSRVGRSRFLLDLRAARNNREANEWLAQPRLLRANFNTNLSVPASTAFDVLVFIDTLTPAGVIKSSP